jgi:hypothetical protein
MIATLLGGAASAVDLEGALSGYLPAGSYTITDDIHVPAGQTLTLAPGVQFSFEEGFFEEYEFNVYGTLNAVGTSSQHIVFQAASGVSEYNYIRLTTSSSHMAWCDVRNAGSEAATSDGGLMVDNCSPLIEHCTVADGTWHGLRVSGDSAHPTIRNCFVYDNANDGIDAEDGAGMHVESCVIRGNGEDGICLSDGDNLIVNTVIHGNGEDGVDCYGITDYAATLLNCTIGDHSSEALSDASEFDLINCAVVADQPELGEGTAYTLVMPDVSFFGFQNPGSGNYALTAGSPLIENGTRFGAAAALLPSTDVTGNPRINGIVDVGAYECTLTPPTGEEGEWFSSALISPRMTSALIRTDGESFPIRIARLGSYGTGSVTACLLDAQGGTHPLTIQSVSHADMTPGSDLADVLLYGPGIERVQTVQVAIPSGTPGDFYGLRVTLAGRTYQSVHAVKVLDAYPSSWGFMQVTDTHVGYDEEEYTAAQRLAFCSAEANILNPGFVVLTGDMCENQNWSNGYADSLLEALALFRVPLLILPGNHDHYNDGGGAHYAHAWMRYHQVLNRERNGEFRFGTSRFYSLNSQYDLGLTELYRCWGPSNASLDWLEGLLDQGTPAGPLFLGMHGPNYDYFSWNANNVSRVRDLLDDYGFSLCLVGHTHRFETFRNEGDNYLGRNDFSHDDDWGRDVAFPGYPLHVQTSSLGKEEHLPFPGAENLPRMQQNRHELESLLRTIEEDEQDGLFGDSIGWRWIQVSGSQVSWFTADTDGDGYRSTENAWILGEIQQAVEPLGAGVIRSTIANNHYETWSDIRHFIPALPGQSYTASGGSIVRQFPDGTVEVAVASLGAQSVSQVTLTPGGTGIEGGADPGVAALLDPVPNPSSGSVTLSFRTVHAGSSVGLEIFDLTGRRVSTLSQETGDAGLHALDWDGRDDGGVMVPAGIYFCRMTAPGFTETRSLMRI